MGGVGHENREIQSGMMCCERGSEERAMFPVPSPQIAYLHRYIGFTYIRVVIQR